ncbi:hypothetical protein D3C77_568750 [compost metagenome]
MISTSLQASPCYIYPLTPGAIANIDSNCGAICRLIDNRHDWSSNHVNVELDAVPALGLGCRYIRIEVLPFRSETS